MVESLIKVHRPLGQYILQLPCYPSTAGGTFTKSLQTISHNLTPQTDWITHKKKFFRNTKFRSRNTQRSKSSKNRRKHEKKKYSTREGSSFEDIGLVAAQHEVISAVYGSVEDVGLLNRALVKFGRAEDGAREIQGELCALLELIKGSLDKIWMAEESPVEGGGGGGEEGVKYGPEATTADIIENRERDRVYLPPYHLLG